MIQLNLLIITSLYFSHEWRTKADSLENEQIAFHKIFKDTGGGTFSIDPSLFCAQTVTYCCNPCSGPRNGNSFFQNQASMGNPVFGMGQSMNGGSVAVLPNGGGGAATHVISSAIAGNFPGFQPSGNVMVNNGPLDQRMVGGGGMVPQVSPVQQTFVMPPPPAGFPAPGGGNVGVGSIRTAPAFGNAGSATINGDVGGIRIANGGASGATNFGGGIIPNNFGGANAGANTNNGGSNFNNGNFIPANGFTVINSSGSFSSAGLTTGSSSVTVANVFGGRGVENFINASTATDASTTSSGSTAFRIETTTASSTESTTTDTTTSAATSTSTSTSASTSSSTSSSTSTTFTSPTATPINSNHAGTCAPNCPAGWNTWGPVTSHCYLAPAQPAKLDTFWNQVAYCRQADPTAYPLVISDLSEQLVASSVAMQYGTSWLSFLSDSFVWLGGYATEDSWKWLDKSMTSDSMVATLVNFVASDKNGTCLAADTKSLSVWVTRPCSDKTGAVICEMPKRSICGTTGSSLPINPIKLDTSSVSTLFPNALTLPIMGQIYAESEKVFNVMMAANNVKTTTSTSPTTTRTSTIAPSNSFGGPIGSATSSLFGGMNFNTS